MRRIQRPRDGLHNPRQSKGRRSRIHSMKPDVRFRRLLRHLDADLLPLQAIGGRLPELQACLPSVKVPGLARGVADVRAAQ